MLLNSDRFRLKPSGDAILERDLPPTDIHVDQSGFVEQILSITAPAPLLRGLHQSAFDWIAMDITQFLDVLLRSPLGMTAHRIGSIVPALAKNARTGHPQFRIGKGNEW